MFCFVGFPPPFLGRVFVTCDPKFINLNPRRPPSALLFFSPPPLLLYLALCAMPCSRPIILQVYLQPRSLLLLPSNDDLTPHDRSFTFLKSSNVEHCKCTWVPSACKLPSAPPHSMEAILRNAKNGNGTLQRAPSFNEHLDTCGEKGG